MKPEHDMHEHSYEAFERVCMVLHAARWQEWFVETCMRYKDLGLRFHMPFTQPELGRGDFSGLGCLQM